MARRGLLVVLEGTDRCGKSTQCKLLVDRLNAQNTPAKLMRFPDRSTAIGGLIDQYLRKEAEFDDHAAHLLFAANRWELLPQIKRDLQQGITLVVDRYAFSGVAFTSAKGLDLEWCKTPDAGLPSPDLHIHLELDPTDAAKRGGFGTERYEVTEFQEKVKHKFTELYGSLTRKPCLLAVSGLNIEQVHEQIVALLTKATESQTLCSVDEMPTLW
eukprot:m.101332 g.101332  ORF g.101332 m.101332 type:complete len:214 (-) comp14972_c2_seq1:470-1111(-)